MNSTEIIYVVTSDDDLPVSLQLLHSSGTLQPQILPKSLLPLTSSAVTVYDGYGNNITEDVTVETYEYAVDEDGEVSQLNNMPNTILSSNCLVSVSSAGCTKLMSEEFLMEANLVSNFKTHGVQMTFSQDSSHTDLDNVQPNGQNSDNIDVGVSDGAVTYDKSVPVSGSFNRLTVDSCVKHFLDDNVLYSSTKEITVDTNHNSDAASSSHEENALPVCVNSSPLSDSLQSENRSVPSLPEYFSYHIPADTDQVDLAADHDCRTSCHLPEYLSDAVKCTTEMAVSSCEDNAAVTNVNSCDTISTVTVEHLQPCLSFSPECCLNSCSCKHSHLCQQSASQSQSTELNRVSTVCSSTDSSCNISSMPSLVSLVTDTDCIDTGNETNSSLCTHSSQTETEVDCKLDSSELQFADHVHKPDVSCNDCPEHSICLSSSVAESSFCEMQQHADDRITAVSVTNCCAKVESVCDITVSKPNHCDMSEGSHSVIMPEYADSQCKFDVPLTDSERVNVIVTDHSEAECLLPSTSYDGSDVKASVQQKDVASVRAVMNTSDVDAIGSNKREQNFTATADTDSQFQPNCIIKSMCNGSCTLGTEMPSSSNISVGVMDDNKTEHLLPSDDFDDSAVEDSVRQKDVASLTAVMKTSDPDDVGSNKCKQNFTGTANTDSQFQSDYIENSICNGTCTSQTEMPSSSNISICVMDHSETECLLPSDDFDDSAYEVSVQQKAVVSLTAVMNTSDLDDVGSNKRELNFTDTANTDMDSQFQPDSIKNCKHNGSCTSGTVMPSSSNISVGVMDHSETECLLPSDDFDDNALEDSVQKDVASLRAVMNTNDPEDVGSNKREQNFTGTANTHSHFQPDCIKNSIHSGSCTSGTEMLSSSSVSVGVMDHSETERLLLSNDIDDSALEDSLQQKDVASLTAVMSTSDPYDVGSNKREVPSNSSISVGVVDLSETRFSFPSADCDGSVVEHSVQQKDVMSLSGVMKTDNLDDTGSNKRQQNFTDIGNTDSMLQPDCTKNCTCNGKCADDVVNSNAEDAVGTSASENYLVSETVMMDTTESIVRIVDQECDVTNGDAECQVQSPCTTSHTYNVCQWDMVKAARNFSNEVHEMKQKLCALHRTKRRLQKLQRNEPPLVASNTDRSQTEWVLDLLHDANCSKRLRLEAIDKELAYRAVLLQHREEQMDLRLQRVEQREQALRERERLLALVQCRISAPPQERVGLMTGVQLDPVQKHPAIEHKSDVAKFNQKSTSKSMPQRRGTLQRRGPHRLCKEKVFACFYLSTK